MDFLWGLASPCIRSKHTPKSEPAEPSPEGERSVRPAPKSDSNRGTPDSVARSEELAPETRVRTGRTRFDWWPFGPVTYS